MNEYAYMTIRGIGYLVEDTKNRELFDDIGNWI